MPVDATLLESIELDGSAQLLFAGDPDDQDSMAANSAAGRAVEKLIDLIVLASLEHFTQRIRRYDDEILRILERLMRLLVLAGVDLDVQPSPAQRPTRLTSGRAGAYLAVLQRQRADEDRPVTFIGRLDGVVAPESTDRRDFRLTLQERWRRRKVIRGTFDTALTDVMKTLLLSDVIVEHRTRGERKSTPRFHLVAARGLDDAQLRIHATDESIS